MAEDGHAAAVMALRSPPMCRSAPAPRIAPPVAKPALISTRSTANTGTISRHRTHAREDQSRFTSRNPLARIAEGYVVIDTAAEGDPKALASDLKRSASTGPAVFGRMVSARLPITAIPALENFSSLRFARPAYAVTQAGDVTSQGDAAMRADIGRTAFGVDGTGVIVGTLSDSYDCLGGAAAGSRAAICPAGVPCWTS